MIKLKTFFNDYFWLIVIAFLIFVGVISFSLYGDYQASRFDKTITNQTFEANKSVREAVNANSEAISYDAERQTEDNRRSSVIRPKLDTARRQSNNSKIELEKSQREYEKLKTEESDLNRSIADNCRELERLFPTKRFEYCQNR